MSELHELVLVEKQLGSTFARSALESRFSAIDVESAFRSVIGWRSTRCGTSRSMWIGAFKWFDLYAYPCCNYFASAADVRTHILADHINNHPFEITIKKASDDDDG
jgi:hypothetical protein